MTDTNTFSDASSTDFDYTHTLVDESFQTKNPSVNKKTRVDDNTGHYFFYGLAKISEMIDLSRKSTGTLETKPVVGGERRSDTMAETAAAVSAPVKPSKVTVRYNKAATLAKEAVVAKTTAQAFLAGVAAQTLPKPRKVPRPTGVAVRYNNAAILAKEAVAAKTTAQALLAGVGTRTLPKPRKIPRASGVAVRYNNAANLARVAVEAKTMAWRDVVGNSCVRHGRSPQLTWSMLTGEKAAATSAPRRRPKDGVPRLLNQPSVNRSFPYPPLNRVLPAENAGMPLNDLRQLKASRPHVPGFEPTIIAGELIYR
jgi:hypothetical protein